MISIAGGANIKCAEYATYGTQKLSNNILEALQKRKACLIANHGQVSIGESLAIAFELAEEVEYLSELYYHSLLIGEPKQLSKVEIVKVLKKIGSYKNNQ